MTVNGGKEKNVQAQVTEKYNHSWIQEPKPISSGFCLSVSLSSTFSELASFSGMLL